MYIVQLTMHRVVAALADQSGNSDLPAALEVYHLLLFDKVSQ